MKVVLFCGGLGTRLGNLSDNLPKPMVTIGYRPILWHLMKYYAHFGHKEFILCLGYKADKIKDYFLNYNEYISNDFTLYNGGKELHPEKGDLVDWKITFVDTGLKSNIGERLVKVKKYLEGEEMFLANYADGLTNLDFNEQLEFFKKSGKTACFLCSKPSQSFHVVKLAENNLVTELKYVRDSDVLINAGFFIFKREIFDYIKAHEELVMEPFQRLMEKGELVAYRYDQFWCMDTFKEHQELNDKCNNGDSPWEVWKCPPVE
jgi:glucose-1-phosphate cytidylyltransferase